MNANEIPALETLCEKCDGNGGRRHPPSGLWLECPKCDGTGKQITEVGERVLDFIWRRSDRFIQTAH